MLASGSDRGGEGKVVYLDTEGTFRPERLKDIAQRFSTDPDFILEKLMYSRVSNPDMLDDHLQELCGIMAEDPEPYRMIIVDSVIMPFRFEYSGRGELSERQQRLGKTLESLKRIAETFNIAVVITNQVMADPQGSFMPTAPKPVGGHVLSHAITTRVTLRKGKGDTRVAKIADSPYLPEAEAVYVIKEGGVMESTE